MAGRTFNVSGKERELGNESGRMETVAVTAGVISQLCLMFPLDADGVVIGQVGSQICQAGN